MHALTLKKDKFETANASRSFDCETGYLSVPLNRSDALAKTVDLKVVRFKTDQPKRCAPFLYLAGGPGQSSFDDLHKDPTLLQTMLSLSDVIAFDQRGTGGSRPLMRFPNSVSLSIETGFSREEFISVFKQTALEANNYWGEQGIHLYDFNTLESVADIDEICSAFSLEQMTLFGASYGSHLGLASMKFLPERVERAILGLVEGLNDTYKLPSVVDRFFRNVSSEIDAVSATDPARLSFYQSMIEVHEALAAKPVELNFGGRKYRLTKFMAQLAAGEALGNVKVLRQLPGIYKEATKGDFKKLCRLLKFFKEEVGSMNAMFLAMDAASSATPDRVTRIETERRECILDDSYNLPIPFIEAEIGARDLGDAFRTPFSSKIPTLMLSGEMDGRTPQRNAVRASLKFETAHQILLRSQGHRIPASAGYFSAIEAFIAGNPIEQTELGELFDYRVMA